MNYKGTFWEKFPWTLKNLFIFLQQGCKKNKSFKRDWESFYKSSPKVQDD